MAQDFKVLQPVEFFKKFLEKDVRPDKRELGETRPTTLNLGSISTADGSALVKFGNTTVVCGIKGELTQPKTDAPKSGFIIPNVDLPALCSPHFKSGPPSEQAQVASLFLQDLIQCSKCIETEDLCIAEGKLVWVLYCDLMCLDFDGNLLDACALALMAALTNTQLPEVKMDEESGLAVTHASNKVQLRVLHQPLATTFSVFDKRILLLDPTQEEESLATSSISLVTLEDDSLCHIHKPGGSGVTDAQMADCLTRAVARGRELRTLIDEVAEGVVRSDEDNTDL